MKIFFCLLFSLSCYSVSYHKPTPAIDGGKKFNQSSPQLLGHTKQLYFNTGRTCSGVQIHQNYILTAGHCLLTKTGNGVKHVSITEIDGIKDVAKYKLFFVDNFFNNYKNCLSYSYKISRIKSILEELLEDIEWDLYNKEDLGDDIEWIKKELKVNLEREKNNEYHYYGYKYFKKFLRENLRKLRKLNTRIKSNYSKLSDMNSYYNILIHNASNQRQCREAKNDVALIEIHYKEDAKPELPKTPFPKILHSKQELNLSKKALIAGYGITEFHWDSEEDNFTGYTAFDLMWGEMELNYCHGKTEGADYQMFNQKMDISCLRYKSWMDVTKKTHSMSDWNGETVKHDGKANATPGDSGSGIFILDKNGNYLLSGIASWMYLHAENYNLEIYLTENIKQIGSPTIQAKELDDSFLFDYIQPLYKYSFKSGPDDWGDDWLDLDEYIAAMELIYSTEAKRYFSKDTQTYEITLNEPYSSRRTYDLYHLSSYADLSENGNRKLIENYFKPEEFNKIKSKKK